MIYLCVFGIVVLSLIQTYRINYIVNTFRTEEVTLKLLLKTSIGWPVGVLFTALAILLVYILKVPNYYIQVIDLLISIIIIAIIDAKSHRIPNYMTISLLISQIVAAFCISNAYFDIWNILISGVILGVLILVSKISKEQIGMGDVKLIVVINLIYGLSFTIYSLIISLLVMLLSIIPFMIMKKINLKSQIPFAPFLTIGVTVYTLLNLL